MSAPITEAHLRLASIVLLPPVTVESAAQRIADSEARAVVADSQGARRQLLIVKHERDQLRAELATAKKDTNDLNNLLRAVGWGQGEIDSAACTEEENEKLRAEVERLGDHATKSEKGNWEASVRAVRAEAEAALTRGFALTLAATLDGAQAELKAYRDAVDAQPWATDEPIRVMLDRVTMLWASEKQAKVERGDMLCECQAELAKERARLDAVVKNRWLIHGEDMFAVFNNECGDYITPWLETERAAVDAAMKEETK